MYKSKRGLPTYYRQPSREELETLESFSYKAPNGLRITFGKYRREGRKPMWNGVVCRKGKSHTVYAGTCKTFDLAKAEAKILKLVAS